MSSRVRSIDLPIQIDERGILVWGQFATHLPFTPVRIFFIRDVPRGEIRGNHAHVKCEQIFIAVSGAFLIECYNTANGHDLTQLMKPPTRDIPVVNTALHVPPGVHVTLSEFTDDAVCLVLASHRYDPDDYI